ncbi:MAG: gamma-glutamylcyclotransferase [Candidatus Nitronauta litoralis]|uniref:Gamma-glutamylcyclotransferase n=1 Tax=Candidatus Nitronauta litoralis TaxID=2705533 RepID=A0A7T0BUK1_9BACT|nr:MAG: gamma-glutamylcyclotransferase [Candidatus Nitronauta litoralis]
MANFIYFFAYDELIMPEVFEKHGFVANARFNVTLSAYKMVFHKIPNNPEDFKEGEGRPTIIPTDSNIGMMEGILYEIDETLLPKLDEYYGHPNDYHRKKMRFTKHDFTFINGFVYMAQVENTDSRLLPSQAQLDAYRPARKTMTRLYFSRLVTQATVEEPHKRRPG